MIYSAGVKMVHGVTVNVTCNNTAKDQSLKSLSNWNFNEIKTCWKETKLQLKLEQKQRKWNTI